jgi:hypothetical protein
MPQKQVEVTFTMRPRERGMRKAERSRPYPPDFVSAATLAYRLDIAERTVTDYARAGILPPPVTIGNTKRWAWAEVEAQIAAQNALASAETDANAGGDEYSSALRKALPPAQKAAAND